MVQPVKSTAVALLGRWSSMWYCLCVHRWCPDLRAVKLHTADPEERKRLKKEVRMPIDWC